jgi:peptide/nickel transport system permease protein
MTVGPEPSSSSAVLGDEFVAPPGMVPSDLPAEVRGRSLAQIAWSRLRRDRVAVAGGIFVIFLILLAVFAQLIVKLTGHPIDQWNNKLIDPTFSTPTGSLGGISGDHWFGVEPVSGRDIFSRIIVGAQTSITVAFLAAAVATILGTVIGISAGFFGGWWDAIVGRTMDLLLAFPQLLFAIALVTVLPDSFLSLGDRLSRMMVLVLVIGFFGWPYIGRIVRGQALSLREREFVEAARSLGARGPRLLFKELLPNLAAPILVYTTLIIPSNILTEAALSFLGVGMEPPNPSWGGMLQDATNFYRIDPMYMIIPGSMIFITVLAFNLFGDGLRDALDPKAH